MRNRRILTSLTTLALVVGLAGLPGSVGARQGAEAARWRTIHNQTFEGEFPPTTPNSRWTTLDHNGSTSGGFVHWDKVNGGFNSPSAMHPAGSGGAGVSTYSNFADTWARYGPFSLAGASDARFSFRHWLATEKAYDFFSWSYSCAGTANWNTREVSGEPRVWKPVTVSLRACRGRQNVFIRFNFLSDYSGSAPGPNGVWVDNVLIQKFA